MQRKPDSAPSPRPVVNEEEDARRKALAKQGCEATSAEKTCNEKLAELLKTIMDSEPPANELATVFLSRYRKRYTVILQELDVPVLATVAVKKQPPCQEDGRAQDAVCLIAMTNTFIVVICFTFVTHKIKLLHE